MKIVLGFTELNQKFGPLGFQHGLASISAVLKQHGFTDIVLAHFTEPAHMAGWEAELARLKPDVVGFYSTAEQFYYVKDLVQRVPPGIFTVTGPFTSPRRTAALAAAQEDDPEACVSPAPRSQIRMKISFGPVGTASWTLVRFGKRAWFSRTGPSVRSSSLVQVSPGCLKITQ